jgi:hypothetical protein
MHRSFILKSSLARICEEENNVKKWVSYFVHKNCKTDYERKFNLSRICEEENMKKMGFMPCS